MDDAQFTLFELAPAEDNLEAKPFVPAPRRRRLRVLQGEMRGLAPDLAPWEALAQRIQPTSARTCHGPWLGVEDSLGPSDREFGFDGRVIARRLCDAHVQPTSTGLGTIWCATESSAGSGPEAGLCSVLSGYALSGQREPCAFVSCRFHLWNEPERFRWFERLVEELEPEEWGETCALAVAKALVLRPSKGGKWIAVSATGGPLGAPPPELINDEWVQPGAEFAHPTVVNAAVLGRYAGVSRETVRHTLNDAIHKLRGDEENIQAARDRGIDIMAMPTLDE